MTVSGMHLTPSEIHSFSQQNTQGNKDLIVDLSVDGESF